MADSFRGSQNWMAAALAFPKILDYMAPFVDNTTQNFHVELLDRLGPEGSCATLPGDCRWGYKRDAKVNCTICNKWREELKKHFGNKDKTIFWGNADPKKWPTDQWEVAKVFMQRGQIAGRTITVHDLDVTSMFELIMNCDKFDSGRQQWKDLAVQVRDARNMIFHHPSQKIGDGTVEQVHNILIRFLKAWSCHYDDSAPIEGVIQEIYKLREKKFVAEDLLMEEDAKGKMVQLKLKEELKEHSKKLQDHDESLNNHEDALNGHGDALNGHEDTLNGHGDTLKDHEDTLNGYGDALNGHGIRLSQLERSISQNQETTQPEQFNSNHEHEPNSRMRSRGVPINVQAVSRLGNTCPTSPIPRNVPCSDDRAFIVQASQEEMSGALPLGATASDGAASVESSGAKPKGARAFPSGASAPDEPRVVVLPRASPRYRASTSSPKHSTPRPFTTGASTSRVPKADEASVGVFPEARPRSEAVASSPRPLTSREGRAAQSYSGYGYDSLHSGDGYNPCQKSIIGNQEIIQPGSAKQVLLLHSTDSQEHLSVVSRLKMFLIMHGLCNVVLLSDYNRSRRFHDWLAIQMRDAHKILVIFSEGAKKWPVIDPSPDDDIFLTALSICLPDFECNNNKYVISHFNYSNQSDVILSMRVGVYKLMHDLDKVIFRIHNFCPSGPQFCLQAPQHLTFETYATASTEGGDLSRAIQVITRQRDSIEFDGRFSQLCTKEDDDYDVQEESDMKSFFSLNNE